MAQPRTEGTSAQNPSGNQVIPTSTIYFAKRLILFYTSWTVSTTFVLLQRRLVPRILPAIMSSMISS